MDESRIFLMPLMINNEKFYCERKGKISPFTFLFVGRLVAHKNVEALIEKFNAHFADKNAVLRIFELFEILPETAPITPIIFFSCV